MDTLPEGAIIGTSAVRRSAQFKSNYPQYSYRNIRGNLNTRLRKLDNQEGENYCAMILAAAGVNRMGWSDRISQHIDIGTCMHAGTLLSSLTTNSLRFNIDWCSYSKLI